MLKITYINNEKRIYDFKKNLHFDFYKKLNNLEYSKRQNLCKQQLNGPMEKILIQMNCMTIAWKLKIKN